MNENEIRIYAGLMKELGLTGLEIKEENRSVRLECAAPSVGIQTIRMPETQTPAGTVEGGSDDSIVVRSPIVGVFYTAPAENAAPYAEVGSHVKQGQTLCIIEAMKLMNEIAAEEDGVITEICASNGQLVEYGTELFRIRRGA